MSGTQQAHPPITDNDEWLTAASQWTSDALALFMTDQRLTPWQSRFIDILRAQLGVPPESAKHYISRVLEST